MVSTIRVLPAALEKAKNALPGELKKKNLHICFLRMKLELACCIPNDRRLLERKLECLRSIEWQKQVGWVSSTDPTYQEQEGSGGVLINTAPEQLKPYCSFLFQSTDASGTHVRIPPFRTPQSNVAMRDNGRLRCQPAIRHGFQKSIVKSSISS